MIWDLDKQCDGCQMNPFFIFTYESTFQYSQYLFPLLASLFLQFEETHIYNILVFCCFFFYRKKKLLFHRSWRLKAWPCATSKVTTHIHILMKCSHKIYRMVTVLMLLANSDIRNNFEQPLSNFEVVSERFFCAVPPPLSQGGDGPSTAKRWLCSTKTSWIQTEYDTPITTSELFCSLASPTVLLCHWVGGSHLLREPFSSAPLCLREQQTGWSRFDCIKPQ